MKVLLLALDSKYIHANLAVRYLKEFCNEFNIHIKEFTINQKVEYILGEIIAEKADLICFSCYIWNIEYINTISYILKEGKNKAKILYGGPEVSFEIKKTMEANSFIDYIIFGEGEVTFKEFLRELSKPVPDLFQVKGLAFRHEGLININESRELIDNLDIINYPYDGEDDFSNKIIYYESSRGCPFNCSFCMSSIDKKMRVFSMERVKRDLKALLGTKARQIKFVDRTFNADYKRAMEIMEFIVKNNKNNMTIHFEITVDIINDEFLGFLGRMPVNMFQFEVGVQSLNEKTLSEINRRMDRERLYNAIKRIKSYQNIHLHLDLIAGLPYEDYKTFKSSFEGVYKLGAEKIQLGFLKVLKGTKIYQDKEKHGIKYRQSAPYEVICTNYITLEDLLKLKDIEELVEKYYNEKYFHKSLSYVINKYFLHSAFEFFSSFSQYWKKNDLYKKSHSRKKLYEIFYDYMECSYKIDDEFISSLKYDYIYNNQFEELPDYLNKESEEKFRLLKRHLANDQEFKNKFFPTIEDKIINEFRIAEIGQNVILFIYRDKDNIFNKCHTHCINELARNYLKEESIIRKELKDEKKK